VTEVLFYHLERRSLDEVLPGLVERSLAKPWRVLIKCESADRAAAIDNLLWTYDEQSFLPHAQLGDGDASRQPVLVTVEDTNANDGNVLFLVGGAVAPPWDGPLVQSLARVVLLFAKARDAGHAVTYWKESASGKFEKQG
jgi:DNA polymerase-3 subunit chi